MAMLSLDNPTFERFAFYSGIAIGKTLLMSALTVRSRLTNKIFSNPEDASSFGGKELIGDERVERIRRCRQNDIEHQNDIENVFPFVLVGFFYVATDPDPWWAAVLFRTFVISRCLHTVCYLTPIPQPSRFVACITGWGVTTVMAALVIRAGRA